METDFCTMIGNSSWWSEQLAAINLMDNDNDDIDDGDDAGELEQLAAINLTDGDNDDIDDGDDEGELLDAAQADDEQSILSKNPWLIRIADPVGDNILHMSVRNGDIEIVYKLIAFMDKHGHEDLKEKAVKDQNVDGDTPLHVAIKNGYRELAWRLVHAKPNVLNMSNNDGITPLQLASEVRFSELSFRPRSRKRRAIISDVELELMKRELRRMSCSEATHWNELHTAIEKGQEDVIETVLTRHGKNLLCWQDKQTWKILLHDAVGAGHVNQLVQFMVENGLTDAALLGNGEGDTALHVGVQKNRLNAARCLIEAAPTTVYQVNDKGVSPLHKAIKCGYHDFVICMFQILSQSLLPACASEIVQHPKNATLAHLAIRVRSLGTLKILMEHLPDLVKATNQKGWRPLSYAANKGYLDEVTYLLTNFPESAEKHDKDGSFPIHKAVGGGHISIIEAFYKHCPQTLHHIDQKGRNVLHIAICYGRDDIFAYLTKELKMDASFSNLKDNEGKTFMDYSKASSSSSSNCTKACNY
ncbi:hypothetical protein RND81_04G221600 [Saponaria officinalis]|uniref:Uncharacterized protein n=1 Tax=Saponaria officinalis TaxID=3572 RepID=A0AAW1LGJ9_SAPOF